MNEIKVFQNEQFGQLRAMLGHEGEPLMMGTDVAKRLGYKNPAKALRDHVDTEDKLTERIVLSGQRREVIFINESGLYSLILSSKLPTAKAFKRWVTAEVLPQIRKTGGYIPTHDAEGSKLSSEEVLALADEIVGRLGIKEKWKVFEGLWHRKYMRSDYNLALTQQQSLDFQDELKLLLPNRGTHA